LQSKLKKIKNVNWSIFCTYYGESEYFFKMKIVIIVDTSFIVGIRNSSFWKIKCSFKRPLNTQPAISKVLYRVENFITTLNETQLILYIIQRIDNVWSNTDESVYCNEIAPTLGIYMHKKSSKYNSKNAVTCYKIFI
jgi:hypothetical protein